MNCKILLRKIVKAYSHILKNNLIGIYVHGSIAFGCFNWNKSDIDFLVVTSKVPSLQEKIVMIQTLLNLENQATKKGFEMSVVLEKYCNKFIYPTPFELHFSNAHIQKCKDNLTQYCANMNGTDKDLAAHFMVTKAVGIVLYGKDIASVFGYVDKAYYIDSIKSDISNSEDDIERDPVYVILNLCRVFAFVRDGLILSKKQGGQWGIENIPKIYISIIKLALRNYCDDEYLTLDKDLAKKFAAYMKEKIFMND